jgi:hypothetical protein
MEEWVKALIQKHDKFIIDTTKTYVTAYAAHGLELEHLLPHAYELAARAAETYDESIGGPNGFERYCAPFLLRLHRIACDLIGHDPQRGWRGFLYDPAHEARRRLRLPYDDGKSRLVVDYWPEAVCVMVPMLLLEPAARTYIEKVSRAVRSNNKQAVTDMLPGADIVVIGRRQRRHKPKGWSRYQDWMHSLAAIDSGTLRKRADELRPSLDSRERALLAWMLRKLDGDKTTLTKAAKAADIGKGYASKIVKRLAKKLKPDRKHLRENRNLT